MEAVTGALVAASIFKNIKGLEYFDFEEDFIEKNMRCIPMIVRLKMDKAGIKLKLAEWAKFSVNDRIELAQRDCASKTEIDSYFNYTVGLIHRYTGRHATFLVIDERPMWAQQEVIPAMLLQHLAEYGWNMSLEQWSRLTQLQRFALLKLCRPGHENKNFPKAIKEFGLI